MKKKRMWQADIFRRITKMLHLFNQSANKNKIKQGI